MLASRDARDRRLLGPGPGGVVRAACVPRPRRRPDPQFGTQPHLHFAHLAQSRTSAGRPTTCNSADSGHQPTVMGTAAATLTDRLALALARIQSTRPLKVRVHRPGNPAAHVKTAPVRHASVAILIRIQPTLEDEESLAEQYDANGQPISGTDAARALQQLCPPPSALGSSAASQSDTASSSEVLATPSRTTGTAVPADMVRRFFDLPWVQRGTPEIFFIERPSRGDENSASQLAFPGGRREEEDENGLYTALRETWQETGIDLAESKDFACIGQLDQREITTSLGQKLLMILSPYVFLQTTPFSPHPDLSPTEVTAAHWVPLSMLEDAPPSAHSTTTVDVAHRLAPNSAVVRWTLRTLVGCLDYHTLLVPNEPVAEAVDASSGALRGSAADDASSTSESQVLDLPEHLSLAHQDRTYPHKPRPAVTPLRFLEPVAPAYRPPVKLWGLTLAMTLYASLCLVARPPDD